MQASTGATITSTARVIYNADAPLDSNTFEATLDAVAPVTVVNVRQTGNTYAVDWSATDDTAGSGVKDYTVYISLNGGPFFVSLTRTTSTSLVYESRDGLAATFLVRAQDSAGNVEPAPFGVSVAPVVPSVNLGSLPKAPKTETDALPMAPPSNASATNPLFLRALLQVPLNRAVARPASFLTVFEPFIASAFASEIPQSGAGIGPLGIAFTPDGKSVIISGGAGRNTLWRFTLAGGRAITPLATLDVPIYDLSFDANGLLWATTGGGPLLQLDPNSGAVLQRFGDGINLGLAAVPNTTRLYVSTAHGVEIFDTATRQFTPFSKTRVDGLALAPDGVLWATRWPDGGEVIRFDQRGRAEVVLTLDQPADGVSFGQPTSAFDNLLFITHDTDGTVTMVDLTSLQSVKIATGGSRGDFTHVGLDGRLFVTQSDQVVVLFPALAPRVIATSPVAGSELMSRINRASFTFDTDMRNSAANDADSVINPANYRLSNADNGHVFSFNTVAYVASSRTATLNFESLPPGNYLLEVLDTVRSDVGVALGETIAARFKVLDDLTTIVVPEFVDTRFDRAAGTVSFDVRVRNSLTVDLLAPIRLIFDGLTLSPSSPIEILDRSGSTVDGHPFVNLSVSATTVLHPGQSLTRTVTIRNPDGLQLDLKPRLVASSPPNQRPAFTSTAITTATAGQGYDYTAKAADPDGPSIEYSLIKNPKGAGIDARSGNITWTPSASGGKSAFCNLRAYDLRGAFAEQSWTVNVTGGNTAPVLAPVGNVVVREGELIEIQPRATDIDGDRLVFGADRLPPGAVFDPERQVLRWQTNFTSAGRYENVTLLASDGGDVAYTSFEILVFDVNQAPQIEQAIDRTVREGDRIEFFLRATDADGDNFLYRANGLPKGAVLEPETGRFEWTPDFQQHGDFNIEFVATDGLDDSTRTVKLTVLNVNAPVKFPRLDKLAVLEGQMLNLRIIANDPDQFLAVSGSILADFENETGGPSEIASTVIYTNSDLPVGAILDAKTHLLSWTPGAQQAGNYRITFTATDDGDGTGTKTTDTAVLQIEVRDANIAPVVEPVENQSVASGKELSFTVKAVDPDGGPLKLTVSGLPTFTTFIDNGNGTATIRATPGLSQRGNFAVTITAADNGNGDPKMALTGSFEFILSAVAHNAAPFMEHEGDKVAVIGREVRFLVKVSDLDEDAMTFAAEGLPPGASFTATKIYGVAEFKWTPAAADAGTTKVTLKVSDSGNGKPAEALTHSRTFKLVARAGNSAPGLVTIAPQELNEGGQLTLAPSATDPDGDALTCSVAGLPASAQFDVTTGRLAWTPNFLEAGNYTVRITASDGNLAATQPVAVVVKNVNQAPKFLSLPGLLALENLPVSYALSASDPDGDPLTLRADRLPSGAIFDPATQLFEWTPGYDQAGETLFSFTATDPSGASATITVRLQVLNVNRAPVISALSNHVLLIGREFRLTIPASDPDAGTNLNVAILDLPTGAMFDAAKRELVWTPVGVQAGE